MPLIGTAGHVDHGKSTLIQQMTGMNPDRWAEERDRGLTIDLGFAWTTLPDGTEVSFVDVPGHERFLKNMLAGIEAIDVALLVVAADEGWMPQSEEHLAVLDLLDVSHGVVAITKCDAVDLELVELAIAETADRLSGTSLSEAPVMAVSGRTGQGVPELLDALATQLPPVQGPTDRPRLWIDRSFAVSGAGTIVTGTLLDGSLSVDDRVTVYPGHRNVRIRGIESHERAHETVGPGRRVALNLGGIDHHELVRGDMVGLDGQWVISDRFSVSLRTPRFIEELPQRGSYQLHIGSSAHRAEIAGVEGGGALLQTGALLPMAVGDRFILRETGRRLIVGGGRILDPDPGPTARALASAPQIDPDASPNEIAGRLLSIRGKDEIERLAAHSRGGTPTDAVIAGGEAVTPVVFDELTARSLELVEDEHRRHPLRPGLSLATLAERIGVNAAMADLIVETSDQLVRSGPDVARADHEPGLTDDQEHAWRRVRDRLSESLSVPPEAELGVETDLVGLKIRNGELVRVSPSLVYLPTQIEEIKGHLSSLTGEFTVADFRDRAGVSRKYAVPILEWSDKEGLTVRRGDVRRFR